MVPGVKIQEAELYLEAANTTFERELGNVVSYWSQLQLQYTIAQLNNSVLWKGVQIQVDSKWSLPYCYYS